MCIVGVKCPQFLVHAVRNQYYISIHHNYWHRAVIRRWVSKFPEVKRDLALLVDKQVTFSALRDVAFATERKLLKSVSLFDVYEGDKLPEGKKSYALSFILEDKTRTLDEKAIERAMQNLTAQFERQCGAHVRA